MTQGERWDPFVARLLRELCEKYRARPEACPMRRFAPNCETCRRKFATLRMKP